MVDGTSEHSDDMDTLVLDLLQLNSSRLVLPTTHKTQRLFQSQVICTIITSQLNEYEHKETHSEVELEIVYTLSATINYTVKTTLDSPQSPT